MKGRILNIQRFSIDDGPGIRTTVFLKGCNMHCLWCHNPESIDTGFRIQFFPQRCTRCLCCSKVCPSGARRIINDVNEYDRKLCLHCRRCIEACNTNALVVQGRIMDPKEVIAEVLRDGAFYETSGGGVTFSGGEPLMQKGFLIDLLKESKYHGLHTAVDTAGNVPWEVMDEIRQYVDLFLYDIKMFSNEKHKQKTGVGNIRILFNLKRLAACKAGIHIRVPIVPGVNDTAGEMEGIAGFLQSLGGFDLIELLPYHSMAESKYESLGEDYGLKGCKPPDGALLESLLKIFLAKNLNAKIK